MNAFQLESYFYFIIFDYSIVFLALLANVFAFCVLVRSSAFSKQSFYRHFLISLITSDIFITVINIATLVYQIITEMKKRTTLLNDIAIGNAEGMLTGCGANALRTLRLAGFFANLLSICGMSLNHFIGVVYPEKYQMLSEKKSRIAVISVWAISFLMALIDIPVNIALYDGTTTNLTTLSQGENNFALGDYSYYEDYGNVPTIEELKRQLKTDQSQYSEDIPVDAGTTRNPVEALDTMLEKLRLEDSARQSMRRSPCTLFSNAKMWFEICVIVLVFYSAILLSICYGIVIKKISQTTQTTGRSASRVVKTTIMLISAFMLCWLPFMIFELVMLLIFHNNNQMFLNDSPGSESYVSRMFLVQQFFNSNLMLYPLVDALIYSCRIPTIKLRLLRLMFKLLPCCRRCLGQLISTGHASSNTFHNATENSGPNSALLEMAPATTAESSVAMGEGSVLSIDFGSGANHSSNLS